MSTTKRSHRVPTPGSFLYAWRQRFNVNAPEVRDAFALLARLFLERDAATQRAFLQWREIWRSTTAIASNPKTIAALKEWTATLPKAEQAIFDPADTSNHDALFFILQTYVAQAILAVVALDYALDDATLARLFEPYPFNWGAAARDKLRLKHEDLDALRLQDVARVRDPFADVYARFFSSPIRRRLGEFYTPAPIARFLYDSSMRLWRQGNPTAERVPTLLDPTCGAGVFLTVALRRRLDAGMSAAEAFEGIRGTDVSPLAVIVARANLLYASTTTTSITERTTPQTRREALERIVEERRRRNVEEPILPVTIFDSLQLRHPFVQSDAPKPIPRYDLLLGNPPWIVWDRLSEEYRRSTRELMTSYGLFTLSSAASRYGGGKKDLSGLFVDVNVARRLKKDGVFGFVTPRSLFQTANSGEGFRRFGAGTDWAFTVLEIDDLSDLYLFTYVGSRASAFLGRAGGETQYPIVARRWLSKKPKARAKRRLVEPTSPQTPIPPEATRAAQELNARVDVGIATPTDPKLSGAPLAFRFDATIVARDDSSTSPELRAEVDRIVEMIFDRQETNASKGEYCAQLGANAAGGSGVFWFDPTTARARFETNRDGESEPSGEKSNRRDARNDASDLETIESKEAGRDTLVEALNAPWTTVRNLGDSGKRKRLSMNATLESELLFPLLRWRDVAEFRHATPNTLLLLPQDPKTRRGIEPSIMRERFPYALTYLARFETELRARAAYQRYQKTAPYWSLYNVDASTFAPIKVVWRRMDSTLRAAVVQYDARISRPVIPQETLSFVTAETLEEADYLAAILNSNPARAIAAGLVAASSRSFGAPNILKALPIKRFDANDALCSKLAALGAKLRVDAQ